MKPPRLIMYIRPVRHPAQKVDNVFSYHMSCGHAFVGNLQVWKRGELCQPLTRRCDQCEEVPDV